MINVVIECEVVYEYEKKWIFKIKIL